MRTLILIIIALLLTACAAPETYPSTPPPGFPTGPQIGQQDRVCSGFTSTPLAQCTMAEFCFIPTGQYCGAADYPGVCRPKPEACTMDYNPVCGCDGQTYPNECAAHAAGVSAATQGVCQ